MGVEPGILKRKDSHASDRAAGGAAASVLASDTANGTGHDPHDDGEHSEKDEDDRGEGATEQTKEVSVEQFFATMEVPSWQSQLTLRGVAVSCMLGVLFCIISLKLSLTTGLVPSLNVSAGLLSFFFIKTWISFLARIGLKSKPFTRQENTIIQTCVVACYILPFSGGFGSYLLSMDQETYETVKTGSNAHIDSAADVKNPGLGWMFGYMFAVSFLGLVAVVPLRKTMIIDYKLAYPSGTATAILINSFHMPYGFKQAKKQILCLGKYFSFSFLFSLFKWFFSGPQSACGFENFPTLGLKAFDNKFFFDFSMTYVGAGMICSPLVNCSLLLGGILSWGLMWPLIDKHAGDWYPSNATGSNLQGLYGYKVFISIALILGDGLYNFVKVTLITAKSLYIQHRKNAALPTTNENAVMELPFDENLRNQVFVNDAIPFRTAVGLYIVLAAISIGVIPKIFPQMRWYYALLSYCVAPILGFCNAYGCGMTDWSLVSTYGKLALFIFSAWAGQNGGIIVGLASCGVMMVIVSCAADLMQDFKSGYLTLTSPRSMFLSQVLGVLMGCIISPLTFWMFWSAFPIGDQNGQYKAPYAVIYREMAILGVQGFSALPNHCLQLSLGFFSFAIIVGLVRDLVPIRIARFIPIPMAMAIPFYIGPYFAIDMCVGSAIVLVWRKINPRKAQVFVPAVASGLICGDGVWTLISAILALVKKHAPICMYFISSNVFSSLNLPKY